MRAARIRMGSFASAAWKTCAVPLKLARTDKGSPISRSATRIAVTAWPSAASGARLNESVTEGNCPWWLMASGAERHLRAVRGAHVESRHRLRALLEARVHLEDDVVLVELGEDGRHLPLAES